MKIQEFFLEMLKKRKQPELCAWGPVWIVAGKHKAQMGYYDDEGDEEAGVADGDERCIVYVGPDYLGAHVTIPLSALRVATEEEAAAFETRWTREGKVAS